MEPRGRVVLSLRARRLSLTYLCFPFQTLEDCELGALLSVRLLQVVPRGEVHGVRT